MSIDPLILEVVYFYLYNMVVRQKYYLLSYWPHWKLQMSIVQYAYQLIAYFVYRSHQLAISQRSSLIIASLLLAMWSVLLDSGYFESLLCTDKPYTGH